MSISDFTNEELMNYVFQSTEKINTTNLSNQRNSDVYLGDHWRQGQIKFNEQISIQAAGTDKFVRAINWDTGDNGLVPTLVYNNGDYQLTNTITSATNEAFGVVKVDGSTITINNGIISSSNTGTITDVQLNGTSVVTNGVANVLALPLAGGTMTGNIIFNNGIVTQSLTKGIKWASSYNNSLVINSNVNPYIGYALDQSDGTFLLGSLTGTNYSSGLAIGGISGKLLWKGALVATVSDISTAINTHNSSTTAHATLLNEKAPLISPALTGIPTAPTATVGTNTTQIATTAFVQNTISTISNEKYVGLITGDGSTTSFIITHNLNTYDCNISVYDSITKEDILVDKKRTGVNTVQINFASPFSNTQTYNVIILAGAYGIGGGSGITNHAQLSNLSYANSGHTGFVPSTAFSLSGTTLTISI